VDHLHVTDDLEGKREKERERDQENITIENSDLELIHRDSPIGVMMNFMKENSLGGIRVEI
jgi:hypothetical protein